MSDLKAAERQAERIRTHSEFCWRWHPECQVERLTLALEEAKKELEEARMNTINRIKELTGGK